MTISTWDPSLETGNELIDTQHRALIGFLDELRAVSEESDEAILSILDRVMDFAMDHFHSEEQLMAEVSYPPELSREMSAQHREFMEYARQRVLEFRGGGVPSILPLQEYIAGFMKGHEFSMDRLLADWVRQRNGTTD